MRSVRTGATAFALILAVAGFGLAQAAGIVAYVATLAGSAGISGNANGVGAAARFSHPSGVALSADGSFALVADTQNHTIRAIDVATGAVTTLAGRAGNPGGANGTGSDARFFHPEGVALSGDGSLALVADTDNHTIRAIDVMSGTVTTLAGSAGSAGSADAVGASARFSSPSGVALSPAGDFALVADTGNHTIRRIDVATGVVTTLAGSAGTPGSANGAGSVARFSSPRGVALRGDGAVALVADTGNHLIRRLDVATGAVTTLAGSPGLLGSADGAGATARFWYPRGVALSVDGGLALVADFSNSTIRQIDVASSEVTTLAGRPGSPGADDGGGARFFYPSGVAASADGTSALAADTDNHTIRRLSLIAVTPRAYLPIVGR